MSKGQNNVSVFSAYRCFYDWVLLINRWLVISYTPSMNSFLFPIPLPGFPEVSLNTSVEIPKNSEGISDPGQNPLNILQ